MKVIAISTRSEEYRSDTGINKRRLYTNGYFSEIAAEVDFILFPVCSEVGIEKIASMCCGLIIAGRDRDIHPRYYGEEPKKGLVYQEDNYEDSLDFKLIEEFSKRNKPIFGICSGLQSINVYFGGTLIQHIDNHTDKVKLMRHGIAVKRGSFVHKMCGDRASVNSIHHQGIKEIAKGFNITAVADDGTIEAIEKGNLIGVQWHPEVDMDIKMFEQFISLCK
ncbi:MULTISPECIES: gamma-glutamyl-gamma-aminobutyrate hydrolase family protein [Gemella]|uniref:gamma-glutamyl-gamma-aminobutyrate hydrolase family protein n=1 Tax=Gemella TaxID=1378 RepID=UPI000768235C|nr:MULTISPECIES: gamma-glutamyl-gamma-aminobutyrate hydrolase family protein [Gemella]AME09815.1 anthranilate synthase [Gemella sp. oral taxon 928]